MVRPSRHAPVEPALVLVLEPDPHIAEQVLGVLASAHYRVSCAASGSEVEALTRAERPSLVILDRAQADVDGLVLTARLRAQTSAAIMLIIERGQTADAVLALKLGADHVVSRPFDAQELEARVEVVLRRVRGREGRGAQARLRV